MSTIPPTHLQSSYPPTLPLPFSAHQPPALRLYPLSNYHFTTKAPQPEEDPSVHSRLKRLQEHYNQHGMRRTVEGILVCHEHNHPHILMLQIANAFFKLPGDYLSAEESEDTETITKAENGVQTEGNVKSEGDTKVEGYTKRSGLERVLDDRLAPVAGDPSGWEIGECLAQWWRPNFETFMYPFVPAHVSRPKECKKLYLVHLPETKVLSVPKNMKLLAVPLFELYDNTARYGPQLSAIPHLLSRYRFEFVDEKGEVVAMTPGSDNGVKGERPQVKVLAEGGDTIKFE